MNKTDIEWADMTWNPVTGCLHGCGYCFARDIAHRFEGCGYTKDGFFIPGAFEMETEGLQVLEEPMYKKTKAGKIVKAAFPFGFAPTLHRYRLGESAKVRKPQNVFVVDMGDLFGEWVPDEWIREVFEACEKAPWHNYMFLTKNAQRYVGLQTRDNYWFGTTVTNRNGDVFSKGQGFHTFASIEPLLEDLGQGKIEEFPEWIIVGAMTGRGSAAHQPKREWVQAIVEQCRAAGVPVFLKNNLAAIWGGELIQEMPEGLRR